MAAVLPTPFVQDLGTIFEHLKHIKEDIDYVVLNVAKLGAKQTEEENENIYNDIEEIIYAYYRMRRDLRFTNAIDLTTLEGMQEVEAMARELQVELDLEKVKNLRTKIKEIRVKVQEACL
jgi:hypothetical protein